MNRQDALRAMGHRVVPNPGMLTVAQLRRDGVPFGIAAAVHAARHLPEWGADALVATVAPKAYEGRGVPFLDLNR